MKAQTMVGVSVVFVLWACATRGQEPELAVVPIPSILVEEQEKQPDKDKKQPDKDKKQPDKKEPAQTDPFDPATNDLSQVQQGFTPNMMGWIGPSYFAAETIIVHGAVSGSRVTTVTIPGRQSPTAPELPVVLPPVTTTFSKAVTQTRTLLVPVSARGGFAIAENESPMPQDRVFVTYNNYATVTGPMSGFNAPLVTTQNIQTVSKINFQKGPNPTVATVATSTTATTMLPGAPTVTVNREVFGFEKTFWDGAASVEMRVPFLQQPSNFAGFDQYDTGDLTIVGRYAIYMDRNTGDAISGGLAITAPTGPAIATTQGVLRDTLLQPFVGYLWNFDYFYFQAFHSVVVPTDPRDVTLLFNDVGFGYRLYQGDPDGFLSSIVPTIEVHVATPLNHRGPDSDPLTAPDIVAITTGVHFGISRNSTLSLGVSTPVTAPRVYGIESFVQLNWGF